ncbi:MULTISPECIES: acyltransferase family protein [unclassified Sphingomonas]|uniref:acyltransferase family protein n=1 Tax=unclassified Sphingomonas TaxID=196159 RepID=UPI0009E87992|nr:MULTISPECIES: acyltransferase [unclassified Sphingomonas]
MPPACLAPDGYQPVQNWEVGLLFGHAGVELFFVLSGFIICWIHYDRIGVAGEVPSYIRKRLVRIYPPVALVVVAWAALSFAAGMPLRPIEYLVSLTLIPFDFAYAPPALWTLTHEMAFYALFLLAFIRRWLFIAALIAWGVAGYVLTMVPELSGVRAGVSLIGSAYAFLFALGVAAFFIVRARPAIPVSGRVALGLIGLAIFAWAASRDVALQLAPVAPEGAERAARALTPWFGLAAMIWIVILADPAVRLRGRLHDLLMLLGNASYAIYLWHEIPQRVLGRLIGSVGLAGPELRWAAMALIIVSGVVLGVLVYLFVEKPLLRWINGRIAARRPETVAVRG